MSRPRSLSASGVATVLLAMALLPRLSFAQGGTGNTSDKTEQVLTNLLRDFLRGAANGDKAAFERFFADDVIYTRAVGAVMDRAKILADVAPAKPGEPVPSYDAEDVLVHQHGDVAVLNFRLVVHAVDNRKQATSYYRNTGTFQRRDGEWKVIAWQATPIIEESSLPGGDRK